MSSSGWLWEKFSWGSWEYVIQILLNNLLRLKKVSKQIWCVQIKALANTDTATWPDDFLKVYLNSDVAGQEFEDCICKLDSEVITIKAQDSNKDIETSTCSISVLDNIDFSQTANLHAKLKLCIVAKVMLSDDISVSNTLINGLIGTVKPLDRRSKLLCS